MCSCFIARAVVLTVLFLFYSQVVRETVREMRLGTILLFLFNSLGSEIMAVPIL